MATYFVRKSGNDSSAGTSAGTAWLTLAKAVATVAAGDTVYVGAGSYYELVTIATSGTIGSVITWIGDYSGAQTGDAGIVRITGAATNNQSVARAEAVIATTKNYNTFRGFVFDGQTGSGNTVWLTNCIGFIVEQCVIVNSSLNGLGWYGASQSGCTVRNSVFWGNASISLTIQHSSTVDNVGHVVQSCLFLGGAAGVHNARVGGVTIVNCSFLGVAAPARVTNALTVGQVMTVNNCMIYGATTGLQATTTAEFSENYNNLSFCSTARSNVTAGANSNTYLWLPDHRWFFEAVAGGSVVSPFDLASYSPHVELNSGTGAPSTDWRGHAVAGTYREWGLAEYVSTYTVGGGGVTMWPLSNGFIQSLIGGGV